MKLSLNGLGLGLAAASGICYSLCAAALKWYLRPSLEMVSSLMHIKKLQLLAPYVKVTLITFTTGLVQVLVWGYVFGIILALIYNLIADRKA